METAYDMLVAQPFLRELTDPQLRRLSCWAKKAVFQAGTRVFKEGGRAGHFWFVRSGQVRLDSQIEGRGEVVVETLGAGSVLGWSWLFEPYRWHFGAVAVETTFAVELDGQGVRQLCEQDLSLGYELTNRFMRVVVDRLQATRMRLTGQDPVIQDPMAS